MDSDAVYPLYVAVKYACYALWCYYGLRLLRETRSVKSAAGFGFLRLLIGVVFGVGIFLVGGMLHLNVPAHPVAMYLSIYAPVRYLEWSIMAGLLLSGKNMARPYFGRTT